MNPPLDKAMMSKFDATQLFCYAISMYVGGVVGDIYDQKKVLAICLAGYATCTVC